MPGKGRQLFSHTNARWQLRMSKFLIVSLKKKKIQPGRAGNQMSQFKIVVFGEIPQDFEGSSSEGRKEPEIFVFPKDLGG